MKIGLAVCLTFNNVRMNFILLQILDSYIKTENILCDIVGKIVKLQIYDIYNSYNDYDYLDYAAYP